MAIGGNGVAVMDPYTEQLASLPQIARRRTAGDGTEPAGGQGAAPVTPAAEGAEPAGAKTLESASDLDAFRTIDQLTKSQDRLRRNRYAIDLYHSWLDSNIQFGRLEKVPNQNMWVAKLAPGVSSERGAAVPNKAADLCNKVTDALLADPPKPNPQPKVDDQSADAAADLVSAVLRDIAGESGINEVQQYRWALRNGLTRSTSFLEYDIDESGGGYQPLQVMAHPEATDPANPLEATDPVTGAPVPSVDPVLRYVSAPTPDAPAGQFVEQAAEADRVWLPKLIVRKHQRTKVLLFPPQAAIEDAAAAIVTDWCSLAEAITRWPDTVGQMSAEELAGLASWRPSFADMIVPFAFKGGMADGMTGPSMDAVGTFSPILQRRMFFHRFYVKKSREYPGGLRLDISGVNGGTRLGQETLEYEVTLPTSGKTKRCRDIALVQVTPIQDVENLDPMGWPFEARFDGSAQADATLIAGYLDALDRMAHPHVFIRSNTAVDEDEWFDRTMPIVIGPSDQMPVYEQFPPLPPVVQVSEHLQTRQDTASGLTATAQGLDSENSQSGIAKKLTVRQAQISLAGIQQQLHGAITRGWRVSAQFIQAKFSTPQLMQFSGEDTSGDVEWWTGEDFAGIDDIGIEPGTGTMMTAEDKANYVAFLQGQQWLTPDRASDIGLTGIARDLGLPKDAVKSAIDRSVDVWLKGPPSEQWIQEYTTWKAEQDAYTAAMQQYQQQAQSFQSYQENRAIMAGGAPSPLVGPEGQNAQAMDQYQRSVIAVQLAEQQAQMSGLDLSQPPQPPQAPQTPMPFTPFETRPNDTEPAVADKWAKRLSHLQMTPQYTAQPKEWRAIADAKYTAARQAVAIAGAAGSAPPTGAPPGHVHRAAPHHAAPGSANAPIPGVAA